jgi:hypothetical protein
VTNAYGNYVVQTFLNLQPSNEKMELLMLVESNIDKIKEVKLRKKWIYLIKEAKRKDDEYIESIKSMPISFSQYDGFGMRKASISNEYL